MKEFTTECRRVRERRRSLPQRHLPVFAVRYALSLVPLALSAAAVAWSPRPWSWLLLAVIAGLTQNAFGILMHEGSHSFFHPNRDTNDQLANWLVCYAIFNTVQGYRAPHLEHHRLCCDDSDPYFGLYGPYERKRQVLQGFLQDVSGLTAVRFFTRRYGSPTAPAIAGAWRDIPGLLAVQTALLLGAFALTGQWWAYFVLWLAPLLTIPIAINRLRTFVEHHASTSGPEATRSTLPNLLEYLAIAPYGYANHFEHHLMPDIPYYQLGWAHAALQADGVEFRAEHLAPAGYVRTFWRLLAELP